MELATHNSWFGGVYQDPSNFFAQIVVEPEPFMTIYKECVLPPEQMKAWLNDRQGASSAAIWPNGSAGDRRSDPHHGTIFQPKTGGQTWEFNIAGIYDGGDGVDKTQFFFQYDYLDENRTFGQGSVGWVHREDRRRVAGDRARRQVRRDVRELGGGNEDDH